MLTEGPQIESILDRCLDDIRSRRATVQDCLARFPERAAELEPLLRTAGVLRTVKEVAPSSAFKTAMRDYLFYLEPPPPELRTRLKQYLVPRQAD